MVSEMIEKSPSMDSMDEKLRLQIDFLRFSLVVGLVLLHYGSFPNSECLPSQGYICSRYPIATSVNSYMYFFFLSSVPTLSAISGYLFFKSADHSPRFYLRRYRSRVRSILLPMISWNAFALILSALTFLLFPLSPRLISYDVFSLRYQDFINALLGLTRHPVHFQFWFLHDLFLTILCAPLLSIAIRRIPWIGLATVFTIWITHWNFWGIFFRADVLFFFYIGAMARILDWPVDRIVPPRIAVKLSVLFFLLVGLRVIVPPFISEYSIWGITIANFWNDDLRLLGVVTLWGIAPLLVETSLGRAIGKVGVLAFFLHAIHWPMNQFFKHMIDEYYPSRSDLAMLSNFVATTILTVLCAFAFAWALNAVAPSLFDHLSGGRSALWSARTRQAEQSKSYRQSV